MAEHLTEAEIERMSKFARKPAYKREPEQLLPDEFEDES